MRTDAAENAISLGVLGVSTLPHTAILLIAVLVIAYVPALSLWLVGVCERAGYL
jgi:hypothetical protein